MLAVQRHPGSTFVRQVPTNHYPTGIYFTLERPESGMPQPFRAEGCPRYHHQRALSLSLSLSLARSLSRPHSEFIRCILMAQSNLC